MRRRRYTAVTQFFRIVDKVYALQVMGVKLSTYNSRALFDTWILNNQGILLIQVY